MKQSNVPTINVNELEVNGVYFNSDDHLIQVKSLNLLENKMHLFNISEQCNIYLDLKYDKHNLVKKIR